MVVGGVVAVVTLVAVGCRRGRRGTVPLMRPAGCPRSGGGTRSVAMPFSRRAGAVVRTRRIVEPCARQRHLDPHDAREGDEAEGG